MKTNSNEILSSINRKRLNKNQKEELVRFIESFLPSTGERRRYATNSLFYIHRTIDAIFMKHAGYGISERQIIDTFLELEYGFRTILKTGSKLKIPATDGFFEQVYDEILLVRKQIFWQPHNEHDIHISVSGRTMDLLHYSQQRIPLENGNFKKTIQPRVEMNLSVKKIFGEKEELLPSEVVPKKYLQ